MRMRPFMLLCHLKHNETVKYLFPFLFYFANMMKHTIIGIFVLRTIFMGLHLDCCFGQVIYKSDNCCYECHQKNTAGTSSVADSHIGGKCIFF